MQMSFIIMYLKFRLINTCFFTCYSYWLILSLFLKENVAENKSTQLSRVLEVIIFNLTGAAAALCLGKKKGVLAELTRCYWWAEQTERINIDSKLHQHKLYKQKFTPTPSDRCTQHQSKVPKEINTLYNRREFPVIHSIIWQEIDVTRVDFRRVI